MGSITSNLENLDLITPNRLKLERNNERSPIAPMIITNPTRIINDNKNIFDSWFENWLLSHVPKLLKSLVYCIVNNVKWGLKAMCSSKYITFTNPLGCSHLIYPCLYL